MPTGERDCGRWGGGGLRKILRGSERAGEKTRLYCIYSVTKETQERIYSLITRAILGEHFKLVGFSADR